MYLENVKGLLGRKAEMRELFLYLVKEPADWLLKVVVLEEGLVWSFVICM